MANSLDDIFQARATMSAEERRKRRRRLLLLLAAVEGGKGLSGGIINLAGTHILAEDFASGGVVGALTVTGATGTPTYSIDSDPDSKFAIDGTNLETADTLDYETATSHVVTISVSGMTPQPLARLFTITVTNVFEDVTPDAFTFNDVASANQSQVYTSNTIVIAGLEAGASVAATVSIPDGGGYIKDGGSVATVPTTATNGTTFALQVTSPSADDLSVTVTLTVGGVSDTYTVATPVTGGGGGGVIDFSDPESTINPIFI
jgi:VCBS repeat-containing protein